MERNDDQARSGSPKAAFWLAVLLGAGLLAGCGGNDEATGPSVDVELFGWAPTGENAQGGSFYRKLEVYPGADILSIKLTQPGDGKILDQETYALIEQSANLPEMTFGENVRLDFDLVKRDETGRGVRVASGATPVFSVDPDTEDLDFSVMMAPARDFAPVGARFTTNSETGQWEYQTVTFDNRVDQNRYWGRTGHRAARTSDGRVIIVGGAPAALRPSLDSPPQLQESGAHGDVQIFEPGSGYTSDLAFDESTGKPQPDGADQLDVERAYHTLTPLGDDRYLVVGGLTYDAQAGETVPTDSIEVIDLKADKGSRVTPLVGNDGNNLTLNRARGMHTATYRSQDNTVVVAGGSGQGGNALKSIEVIDVSSRVVREAGAMAKGRAQHEAIRVSQGDERQAIWVLGGWSNPPGGALQATAVLKPNGTTYSASPGPLMSTGRFNMAATRLSIGGGIVAVCGGYTSVDEANGQPSDTCETGRVGANSWDEPWSLGQSRAGGALVELSQSDDLVLLGGRGDDGSAVGEAERLEFKGGNSIPPYEVKSDVGSMVTPRYNATTTRLNNGMILLTGGVGPVDGDSGSAPLASLEYYNPEDVVSPSGGDGNGDGTGENTTNSTTGGTSDSTSGGMTVDGGTGSGGTGK